MERASGPPVGLIVAPILLCVLIAALIFLWIKYREHKKRIQEQVVERMMRRTQGDTESIPSATTPGANSTHPSESESIPKGDTDKPLLSTSAGQSDEPVQSPESASESVVFTDEQSEKGTLDPIEERDDNQDNRVRSARQNQAAAAPRHRMVPQGEPSESVDDQDPSESGGEQEDEEPETFRIERYDSGYRSAYRQRPYYRDMYGDRMQRFRFPPVRGRQGRQQPHIYAEQNDSDESETEMKRVVPSRHPQSPIRECSESSDKQQRTPVEHEMPATTRPGQESSDYTGRESTRLMEKKKGKDTDNSDSDDDVFHEGKRLQNNVQEDSEDEAFTKKYIV